MPDIKLLEMFIPQSTPDSTDSLSGKSGLLLYSCTAKKQTLSYLVIKGAVSGDIVSYCKENSPEIYTALQSCLQEGSLSIDLAAGAARRSESPDKHPETVKLVEALITLASFPKKTMDSAKGAEPVSIILGAGKGTRMRSSKHHKVCFPIAGRPAINRLLDQLESVGIHQHIIVVGEKGRQVVRDVTEVRDNVTFVYQINQNGTGNAAKQAAYLLSSQGFTGDILVIAGDKVVENSGMVRLMENFGKGRSDIVFMTDEKKYWPDAGRIVFDRSGNPVDIIEKRDIQKMILCEHMLDMKRKNPETSSRVLLNEINRTITTQSKARKMLSELFEILEREKTISLDELERVITRDVTGYSIQRNGETYYLSGKELEQSTPQTNAAVYLFSSEAFFSSVFKISSDNAQKEEYFTEIFKIFARDTKRSWNMTTTPVKTRYEVMSFNNPEELLKVEEYYSRKESKSPAPKSFLGRIDKKVRLKALHSPEEWLRKLENFGPDIKRTFRKIYGSDEAVWVERREGYRQALDKFIRVYGKNNSVTIVRSPGHVNLMGRHVDHQGGYTNVMTINREVILVAGIREDDIIRIHNVDSHRFRPRSFSIGHELSLLPWDEWMTMINSETVQRMIHTSHGDWSNYFKASALRLQEKFKDHLLYGFNGVVSGQIPPAAGLSSSSAIVVSAAEALTFINSLSLVPKDFIDLCGESEWFIGSGVDRGNYVATKFGKKGNVMHLGFEDVRVEDVIPFPSGHRLVVLLSHQKTGKSVGTLQILNERVATYELALELIKLRFPQYGDRLQYFRDINRNVLGFEPWDIYDFLLSLPERVTRKQLMKEFPSVKRSELERIFSSHREPSGGYKVREIALFGLSEIARAQQFVGLLKDTDISAIGSLMNVSHNGDRVSYLNEQGARVPYDSSVPDSLLSSLKQRLKAGDATASLYLQPGGYGCSTFLIDEMADIAKGIDGVAGAQISGAGLGGCIMALVRDDAVEKFRQTMTVLFYDKHNLIPEFIVCTPAAGSGIFNL